MCPEVSAGTGLPQLTSHRSLRWTVAWPFCQRLVGSRQADLKVGREEGVPVGLLDELRDLTAKKVVHDAGALLEAVQAGKHGLDGRLGVSRVQLCNGLIAQTGHGREHLGKIAAHVRVWAVPERQVGHLSERLHSIKGMVSQGP